MELGPGLTKTKDMAECMSTLLSAWQMDNLRVEILWWEQRTKRFGSLATNLGQHSARKIITEVAKCGLRGIFDVPLKRL